MLAGRKSVVLVSPEDVDSVYLRYGWTHVHPNGRILVGGDGEDGENFALVQVSARACLRVCVRACVRACVRERTERSGWALVLACVRLGADS